jgi:hypothetical protein
VFGRMRWRSWIKGVNYLAFIPAAMTTPSINVFY